MAAIERAKELGTYGQPDRSAQYTKVTNGELLRAVNEAWTKIRTCEKVLREKETQIAELHKRLKRYQIAHTVLISIITGLAWEGLKALFTLIR